MAESIKKYVRNSVIDGFSFGHETYDTFLSFTIKFISHSLPAIFMGHYLDQGIYYVQRENYLGRMALSYMILQIFAWMLLFYGLFHLLPLYAAEFQGTLTGIFFVALFFVVQTNFIKNTQTVLGKIDNAIEKNLETHSESLPLKI
jgi:hypothetical protein